MKRTKWTLARAIGLTLALLLAFAGCTAPAGDGASATPATTPDGAKASETATPAAPAQNAEPVKITMIQRLNADYVVDGNPVLAELMKRANVNLVIEAPPINNYTDRLNAVMASGDLPDIVYTGADDNYRRWAADGMFLKLDDYLSKMPSVRSVLTDFELSNYRIPALEDGLYGLPRVQTKTPDMIIYRGDWLEKLGLAVPETPEDFAAAMKKIADSDVDGNGKKDVYGWSMNPLQINSRNFGWAFGIVPNTVPGANGEYLLEEAQQGYFAMLDWEAAMFKDGSMDPEWYLNKQYDDADKFRAGKVAVNYKDTVAEHLKQTPEFYETNPGAKIVGGPPLRAKDTAKAINYYAPQVWGGYCVNAESKAIDGVIAFLDFAYTDEANVLLYCGLQGLTYSSYDESLTFYESNAEQQANAKKYVASYATFNFQRQNKGLLMMPGSTKEEVQFASDTAKAVSAKTDLKTYIPAWEAVFPGIGAITSTLTELNTKRDELRTKYICGQIGKEEYKTFLDSQFIPAYEPMMKIIREVGPNK